MLNQIVTAPPANDNNMRVYCSTSSQHEQNTTNGTKGKFQGSCKGIEASKMLQRIIIIIIIIIITIIWLIHYRELGKIMMSVCR